MCCSVSPNIEVRFSDTILYAAEVTDPRGGVVHVLGYQNRAQNNVNRLSAAPKNLLAKLKGLFIPTNKENTGNAMILPFPAVPGTMSRENVLDTENCPDVLKDIAEAVKPVTENLFLSQSASFGPSRAVQIFEAAGIYTVVLADDARAIPEALDRVPKEKRPALNPELFEAYAEWYPDWTIALCCFNNEEAQEALPMLWWYEPMFPEQLFLPALDCHTGDVPDLTTNVAVDHTLAVGSALAEISVPADLSVIKCALCATSNARDLVFCLGCGCLLSQEEKKRQAGGYRQVYYRNPHLLAGLKSYLLSYVIGNSLKEQMPNGDFICRIDEVRKGIWNPLRTLPPNAN
jgi:hypothetical protein